jgi:lysozyme family protein
MDFGAAFDALIGNEGGYSNDPADPGGETMWGVTARVARRNGYTGAMKDLPRDTAKQIAKTEYWDLAHCDQVPDVIRFDHFDTAYNSGVHEAIVLLQRSLGIEADGWFGPETEAKCKATGSTYYTRCALAASRLEFFTDLPGWEHDGKGWARRIAANLRRA